MEDKLDFFENCLRFWPLTLKLLGGGLKAEFWLIEKVLLKVCELLLFDFVNWGFLVKLWL